MGPTAQKIKGVVRSSSLLCVMKKCSRVINQLFISAPWIITKESELPFVVSSDIHRCLFHPHILPLRQHWSNENPWKVASHVFLSCTVTKLKDNEVLLLGLIEFPFLLFRMNSFKSQPVAVSRTAFHTEQGRCPIVWWWTIFIFK